MAVLPFYAQTAVLGFIALLCAAAWSDVKSLTIPNRYTLAIALLFPVYLLPVGQLDVWLTSLAVGGSMLLVGFLLFARGILGGGDAKLMAAVSLWAGLELLPEFMLLTGLAGGAMALVLWLRERLHRAASVATVMASDVESDFGKTPMPYGLAIGIGGVYVAFTLLGLV